jgi:choline-glycine betaine transporter
MSSPLSQTIISLVITAVIGYQAATAAPHSYKRRSFAFATGAFGILTLFNARVALAGQQYETATWVTTLPLVIVFILLTVSLIYLVFAWRKGEMQAQLDHVQEAFREERERRETVQAQKRETKEPSKKEDSEG